MITEKLYYQDSYLREFDARILKKSLLADGKFAIILDRTAFYPEGGGQPCDLGTLNGVPVIDVRTINEEIVHTTDGGPTAGCVSLDDDTLVKIIRWLQPGALIAVAK